MSLRINTYTHTHPPSCSISCAGSPCKPGSLQTDASTHTHTHPPINRLKFPPPALVWPTSHTASRDSHLSVASGHSSFAEAICVSHSLPVHCFVGLGVTGLLTCFPPLPSPLDWAMIIHVVAGKLVVLPCKWLVTCHRFNRVL